MFKESPEAFIQQNIKYYVALFKTLECPEDSAINGDYAAEFIGPSWLRFIAPKLLPLGGLSGWYGKRLLDDGGAINLLGPQDQLTADITMVRSEQPSFFGTGNALCLTYDGRAPIGLRGLRDELRSLDEQTLLGLTVVDWPVLRKLPMPFLLRRNP